MIEIRAVCDGCNMAGPKFTLSQWNGRHQEEMKAILEDEEWFIRTYGAESFILCGRCVFDPLDIIVDRRYRNFPDEIVKLHNTPSGNGNFGGNLRPPIRWSMGLQGSSKS